MASSILRTKNATFIVGKFSPRHLLEAKRRTSRNRSSSKLYSNFFISWRETKIELKINTKILKLLPSSWKQKDEAPD
jgi:hypothetical protein